MDSPRDQPSTKRQKREFSSLPPQNALPPFLPPPGPELQHFLANIAQVILDVSSVEIQNPQLLGFLNQQNWQGNPPNWNPQQTSSTGANYNPV